MMILFIIFEFSIDFFFLIKKQSIALTCLVDKLKISLVFGNLSFNYFLYA